MITRLARRFGFSPSVPVSVVDDWLLPRRDRAQPLAPRGGAATVLVDGIGRLQPVGRTWTMDWTVAGGARWVSAIESDRVRQRMVGAATLETTVETPAGEIVHRVAAAVVDGEPVALVEIENRGGVAVAVGIVARPLVHGGRGFLEHAAASGDRIDLGTQGAIHYEAAGATAAADGVDLLASMPAADGAVVATAVRSRAGAAQAAAVFALPHTATVRFVVEVAGTIRPSAGVPSIADVERGWERHLGAGAGFDVGETGVGERLAVATRGLLTGWPTPTGIPAAITALAEAGHGDDAKRLLADLDRLDDDHGVLAAVARFAQLGDEHAHLDVLDEHIGPLARAIQTAAAATTVTGPTWLPGAFHTLAGRLDLIDQPDVAERVRSITVAATAEPAHADIDDLLAPRADVAALAEPVTAARLVLGVRSRLIADQGDHVDLLPALPTPWRGQSIDVLRAPIDGGTMSFGLRWHGPRPALLWEVDRPAGPVLLTAAALDPSFSTQEPTGETLLADPGWPRS